VGTEFHYFDSTILVRDCFAGVRARSPKIGAVVVSSEVVRIEFALVIERRRIAGTIEPSSASLLRKYAEQFLAPLHLFPLANEMIECAEAPFSVAVNGLDAIHVATAEVVARDTDGTLLFWTLDPRRAAAAAARGLAVRGPTAEA
jgi:hypothetical protein